MVGTCVCPGGETVCGTTCAVLDSDESHCGACGAACELACLGGACAVTALFDGGDRSACVMFASGDTYCWGERVPTPTLQPYLSVSGAARLHVGYVHHCIVMTDGSLRCRGQNSFGQLGDGTTSYRTALVTVPGLTVAQASVDYLNTCAALTDGTVRCWGRNSEGAVGIGMTSTYEATPRVVVGLSGVVEVSVGTNFVCARRTAGTVACWGVNAHGELGDGTTTNRSAPVEVLGLTDAVQISAGFWHACAVRATGEILCWGRSDRLGAGAGGSMATVVGVTDAVQVSAGWDHTCATRATGEVRCWGRNAEGQLGVGTTVSHTRATADPGLTGVMSVHAGHQFTCARFTAGGVRCWGANNLNQMGDGTTTRRLSPVPQAW